MTADDPRLPPDDAGDDSPGDERGGSTGGDEGGVPPPATWAGRARSGEEPGGEEGDEASSGDADGDGISSGDGDGEGEGWGFTEAFDQVDPEPEDSSDDGGAPDDVEDEVEAEAEPEADAEESEDAAADGEDADGEAGEASDDEDDEAGEASDDDEDSEHDLDADGGDGAGSRDGEATAVVAPTQETVEADTLALADREAAEEAALAGLRERAAQKESNGEAARADASPTPAPSAAVAEPVAPKAEPELEGAGDAPRPKALWVRFLVASLVIVVSMATATSVTALVELDAFADRIRVIRDITPDLDPVEGGDPQTILILGSDKRLGLEGGDEAGARSDTAILLRVDPDRDAISLLSIPRDLKVNIPGVGPRKFNEAYAFGGPKLTLKTVKQLTDLNVNHVVNINFTGFADAVNAIDCVYIDVDRRYYVPEGSGYAAIDPPIEAGYQRLCGLKALQYVRFRHDDNDLVRAARQQDFLREARQKIPPSRLWSDRDELIDIFTEYTTSSETLASPIQLLELMKTFLAARGGTVNEVHFPAQLGDADSIYVTANQKAIQDTVREFLNAGTPPADESEDSDSSGDGGGGGGGGGQGEGAKGAGGGAEEQPADEGPPMTADYNPIIAEHAQRVADATSQSGRRLILDFPVFYPTEVPAATNINPLEASRAFPIDGPGDDVYEGYKLVFGLPGDSGFTEYWGISGTNWRDPPILENPTDVKEIDGREYLRFYDGSRLRVVGWKQGGRSYWVNNTLLQTLSDVEMMAIARSMTRLGG